MVDALSSFTGDQGSSLAPVNIRPCRDILKLYFQDSNKYAGLIALPALCRLLNNFVVKLNATLITSQSKPGPTTVKNSKKLFASHECSVRITVYGLKSERSAISELLSQVSLYFQHPSATECELEVEYCNPHYLVRPGDQLPALDDSLIDSDNSTIKASGTLDEVEKSRLLQVFDSTDDFEIASQFTASPRLQSTLKE